MEPSTQPSQSSSAAVPIAIVVGFAMVAIAVYFTAGKTSQVVEQIDTPEETAGTLSSTPKPITEDDYIRGNPNAPILLVEYSDYDCPYCKQYHETLNQVMDEYGVTGRVAWVYRQFPIVQLHPNSPRVSQAALCVGQVAGNDAFWKFTDLVFEERELNEPTNVTKIPEYVREIGVDESAYADCVNNNETEAELQASLEDGFNIGVRGTPHTVLIVGNQQAVINGAESYDTVVTIIENLLAQIDGATEVQ